MHCLCVNRASPRQIPVYLLMSLPNKLPCIPVPSLGCRSGGKRCTCMYDSIQTGVWKWLHTLLSYSLLDEPQSFSWETLTNKQQLLLLEAGSVSSLLQQSRTGAARRQKCKVPIAEDTHRYQRSSLPSLSQDRIQCCLIHLLPRILSFCDSCLSRAFHFIFPPKFPSSIQ